MFCYKDRAFCASPNCANACGRKITEKQRAEAINLDLLIAWGYFCGIPQDNEEKASLNEKG